MAIGGLEHKILGSIKSGVNAFIYPEENRRNYERFIEKYNVGINIDPEKPNIDSALKALKNLDQIYQNIEDVNLKYANLNTVSQQYLSLI